MSLCAGDSELASSYKDHRRSLLERLIVVCRISTRNLRHYVNIPTGVFLISLLIVSINLHETRKLTAKVSTLPTSVRREAQPPAGNTLVRAKQVWVKAKNIDTGYLKHVTGVLQSVGYSLDGGTYSDWDLLWAHEYPYGVPATKTLLINLKPHQKVNKWPGSGYVTSKVTLATSPIKHIPKAFELPVRLEEFKEYAAKNPDALWVQKSNKHRGIRITPVSELDLSASNTFVQQFVDQPMIIDKKKFDIGVYVVITSMEPLRIYIVNHEILLRFCAHEYYPFDASDKNKYVVTDDYTPIWEIPSLNKYFSLGFTAKQSLHQYLTSENRNAEKVFSDIESTIRDVYLTKLSKIKESLKSYNHRNFFEMVRFDFVLDENAELYLMEVNMSPNLSSKHFAANRLLYEQVVYNLLHLVGLASDMDHRSKLEVSEQEMLTGPRDLSVEPEQCSNLCNDRCKPAECRLCYSCMTTTQREILIEAYREHTNKRNTKRVMPPPIDPSLPDKKPEYWEDLSEDDRTMHLWFAGKCKADRSWC